jgi:hypothetical protein
MAAMLQRSLLLALEICDLAPLPSRLSYVDYATAFLQIKLGRENARTDANSIHNL